MCDAAVQASGLQPPRSNRTTQSQRRMCQPSQQLVGGTITIASQRGLCTPCLLCSFLPTPFLIIQDPTGAYIKRWVPELSSLPASHIHTPWTASEAELAAAGVVLGETYPHRCVIA
jgi:hypothetical protein